MLTRYDLDDITFQEPPEPPPPSRFIGGSGGAAPTSYEGLTLAQLIKALQERRITPVQLQAELAARKDEKGVRDYSDAAIKEILAANPPPTGAAPGAITPPELTGGAGLADLTALSAADLNGLVGKPDPRQPGRTFTSQDAENVLRDKGLSPAETRFAMQEGAKKGGLSQAQLFDAWTAGELGTDALFKRLQDQGLTPEEATTLINTHRDEAPKTHEWKAIEGQLTAHGLGPNLHPETIMKGAEAGLWSPNDAYEALVIFAGLTEDEANSTLDLRGWLGGPLRPLPPRSDPTLSSAGARITPPSTGSGGLAATGNAGDAVEKWRPLVSQYFRPEDVDKALYVIKGESGGNPSIKAAVPSEQSWGLFQLNIGGGLGTGHTPQQLQDPETNIKIASQAVYGGSGWSPWGENNTFEGKSFGALGAKPYPGAGVQLGAR